jgi:hypothetical protein
MAIGAGNKNASADILLEHDLNGVHRTAAVVTNDAFVAKGDLIVGTGNGTFGVLTAGANNTGLVADSTQTTGLKWGAASPVCIAVRAGSIVAITNTNQTTVDTIVIPGGTLSTNNIVKGAIRYVYFNDGTHMDHGHLTFKVMYSTLTVTMLLTLFYRTSPAVNDIVVEYTLCGNGSPTSNYLSARAFSHQNSGGVTNGAGSSDGQVALGTIDSGNNQNLVFTMQSDLFSANETLKALNWEVIKENYI